MSERKIIYLDDAVEAITQYLGRINRDFDNWKGTARIILDHVPSEDVQPVVHGEWIPVTAIYKFKEDQFPQTERVWVDATEPDEIDAVKCSICGEVFDFADARNWCTQCGADMRGEQDG